MSKTCEIGVIIVAQKESGAEKLFCELKKIGKAVFRDRDTICFFGLVDFNGKEDIKKLLEWMKVFAEIKSICFNYNDEKKKHTVNTLSLTETSPTDIFRQTATLKRWTKMELHLNPL